MAAERALSRSSVGPVEVSQFAPWVACWWRIAFALFMVFSLNGITTRSSARNLAAVRLNLTMSLKSHFARAHFAQSNGLEESIGELLSIIMVAPGIAPHRVEVDLDA